MKLFNFLPRKKTIIILIFLGLLIRIIVMFYSLQYRENTDMLRWKDWGRIAYLHGLASTYKTDYLTFGTYPNNMPPGTLYNISFMYNLNIATSKILLKAMNAKEGSVLWINNQLPTIFLRIPSIICDLLITFLIYNFVSQRKSEKKSLFTSSLFLFNPAIIYNSSFWGQMDSINNLFMYISIYLLFKKHYFLSIFCFFLSLYVKLSLIFFLPLVIYTIYKTKKGIIKIGIYIFSAILLISIITIPITSNPIVWLFNFIKQNGSGEMTRITNYALNFWWLIFFPYAKFGKPDNLFNFSQITLLGSPDSSLNFFALSLNIWAILIFMITAIPIIFVAYRKRVINPEKLFLVFSMIALLAFLFLPRMHERYMYPVFPLLATYIGFKKGYSLIYVILSLLSFLNLYLVWHPMIIPLISYQIISNRTFQLSLSAITVISTLYFYIRIIKNSYHDEKI